MSKASPSTRERLYLLDGMALAYRAYFSFINRPLINSRGENTSAIYGFVLTLMKILNDDRPDHCAVVFDTKQPTFRHIMYDQYKATREKMPEDMASQMDRLKEVVSAFNVPGLELPGYEADDIMGTLARRAERSNIETYLVTGDKDFMQLVSPHIRIYRPGKGGDDWELVDISGVKDRFGVDPEQVIDVLGLTGDKSDNVPGVFGVGDKTAIPLIQKYGSIENLYRHLDEIPQSGLREKLRQHKDSALLSKKLVTIDTEVPIEADLHSLTVRPHDTVRLTRLFTELEFRTLLKKIAAPAPADPVPVPPAAHRDITSDIGNAPHEYQLVRTEKELVSLVKRLTAAQTIAVDTETTGVDPLTSDLVGISVSITPGEAWYIPVKPEASSAPAAGHDLFAGNAEQDEHSGHCHPSHENALPLRDIAGHLGPVLADSRIGKVGQNIKYDMLVLQQAGMTVSGVKFDSMVASYLLRPDAQHNMDALAAEHLGYRTITYDDLTGTGRDRLPLRAVPVESICDYAAEDADITLQLCNCLRAKLAQQKMSELGSTIEFPLIPILARMEILGIALDVPYLSNLSKEIDGTLQSLTSNISAQAGEPFNLNSTQQLSKILFEKLGLRPVRKTKTGYSTDVGVLEELRHDHPIIEQLIEYRQLQKLKSTYIDALPGLINPTTGRIHTSFNQTVAATGRLSSSDPNLQNIPIRTETGRKIRRAFVPGDSGLLLLSADYSQIELRVMAHASGDDGLIQAFKRREDIHTTTAARVFGVSPPDVTQEMRRRAKEINYGIMYGIGPFGLGSRLDISQAEAKGIIDTYFSRFPKVQQYIRDTLAEARTRGYVSTLLGRRRYLPDLTSKNQNVRNNAERQAINMPIQGTAADMIKLAMIRIDKRLGTTSAGTLNRDSVRMLLQVHDELVFEVSKKIAEKAKKLVIEEMEQAMSLSVPIEVEAGTGKNWLEAH